VTHGGYPGLTRALSMSPAAIVQAITTPGRAGAVGRGVLPYGHQMEDVARSSGRARIPHLHSDEGDSGTFSARI